MRGSLAVLVILVGLGCAESAEAQGINLLDIPQGSTIKSTRRAEGSKSDLIALARRTRTPQTTWGAGRPLSDAVNAHSTNTHEQMKEALEGRFNWLEGDVRREINHEDRVEMRHDEIHESGDNLTLAQWLAIGNASGRGLKLDVKEPDHMDKILGEIEREGVPQERLMLNLGFDAMATWGERIRERFPQALLAINPPSGDGPLSAAQVAGMVAQARRFGGPATFVVHVDRLTDDAIREFKTAGTVSVWNSPSSGHAVTDPVASAAALRARGVDGVIDLRPPLDWPDKASRALDWGLNAAHTQIDRAVDKVESLWPW